MREFKIEDLTGRKFGRLTVIERGKDILYPNKRYKRGFQIVPVWRCYCECSPENIIEVRADCLKNRTKSCGCLQKEKASKFCRTNKKKYNKYDLNGEYGIGWTTNTNKEFYFDLEDYDKIKDSCWFENDKGYIKTTSYQGKRKNLTLHRLVMDFPKIVDHINGEKNDNRKSQLRAVTKKQNSWNHKTFSNNKSGYTGVHWHKRDEVWSAYIRVNGNQIHLGSFVDKEDAIKARKEAEQKYFGEYARNENIQ